MLGAGRTVRTRSVRGHGAQRKSGGCLAMVAAIAVVAVVVAIAVDAIVIGDARVERLIEQREPFIWAVVADADSTRAVKDAAQEGEPCSAVV